MDTTYPNKEMIRLPEMGFKGLSMILLGVVKLKFVVLQLSYSADCCTDFLEKQKWKKKPQHPWYNFVSLLIIVTPSSRDN